MRQRFYAKQVHLSTQPKWRIYDSERGSFPYRTPELGVVTQDHSTEKAAEAEAGRLQQLLGDPTSRRAPAAPTARRDKRRTTQSVEVADTPERDLADELAATQAEPRSVPANHPAAEQATEQATESASAPAAPSRRKTQPTAKSGQTQARSSQPAPATTHTAAPGGGRKLGTAQQALWDALLAAGDGGLTATEAASTCGVAATNAATALRKFTERGWASGDGGRPQRFTANPDAGP